MSVYFIITKTIRGQLRAEENQLVINGMHKRHLKIGIFFSILSLHSI